MNESSLIQKITTLLTAASQKAFPEMTGEAEVTPATQEKFGHYQCNSAMKLTKIAKKPPREIAQQIIDKIEDKEGLFSKIEIAGPGFINLTISSDYLSKMLDEALRAGPPVPAKKERIIVEFSSPNIAKEMHVGHLRSTIIGECLARLFEYLGHDVLRLNHVGDWGTQFGMLITYMREVVPEVLEGKKATDLPALMEWYRASKKRFDEDEGFKERARQGVVALQSGDPESKKAWEMICEISRKGYQEVYDLLDVKLNERGESFYNSMLSGLVQDLEKKGLVTPSEGAKCLFLEGYKLPLMVQKSDGGFGYDATDLAAMSQRVKDEKADRIIVITDAGQSLHFDLLFHGSVKAGYLDPKKVRFDHVPFGLVLGNDGKKFRTRAGDTEKLIDLLNAAVEQAQKILADREHNMNEAEVEKLAKILGIDAVKYADLSCNRISDYQFSYDRMLRFEGNTAAFILYSYVRISGIKRKVGDVNIEELMKKATISLNHPSEIELGLHLLRFRETLEAMAEDLFPNYLTDYLFNLAQKFNGFFRDCRVEGSAEQESRLLLCEAAAKTMARGLHLLGLQTVERM
ncbi:MAG: Arginine--tRNA ligase [Chlamydiae bacterium]|nr:Arginine--tRNA ligase [Chlamydiota bacterium]